LRAPHEAYIESSVAEFTNENNEILEENWKARGIIEKEKQPFHRKLKKNLKSESAK
jgi:hypothetical protein